MKTWLWLGMLAGGWLFARTAVADETGLDCYGLGFAQRRSIPRRSGRV